MSSESHNIIENIVFSSDDFSLKGILHMPAVSAPPVVIGSHGLFSDKHSPKQIALADACNQEEMAFFRFDHRGCGESQGDFNEVTSLEGRCHDLICAIEMIFARSDTENRIGLFGSSMGGAVCLAAAARMPADISVSALVTMAAPVRIRSAFEAIRAIENDNESDIPGSSFYKKSLCFDLSDRLSRLHHILIFHGDADNVIPFSNAEEIYQRAREPKKLIRQTGGDHRMSHPAHQEVFMQETVAWFRQGLIGN